jgi:hypothetical protein
MQATYTPNATYSQVSPAIYYERTRTGPFTQAVVVRNMYNEVDAIVFNPEAAPQEPQPSFAPTGSFGYNFRSRLFR